MKILHISKFAYPERGGIETFVRDLAARQQQNGHLVNVLCHQARPGQATDTVESDGVKVFRARMLFSLSFAPISPRFPFLLRSVVRSFRPDVLHLHLPNTATLFNALLPARIPLVVQWHADVQGSPSRRVGALYPAYRVFERQCLAKAAGIIVSSPPYLESSRALAGWRQKCHMIPLGLDQGRYPESPSVQKDAPPLIVSVGRFVYYKGYEHLVRAAQSTPDARFVIAGEGPLWPEIRSEVERLGLSDRVLLPGGVSDDELHELLQRASIFCLPSVDRGEAFGMSQLEAMRYGLPLVSTAIPGSGADWVNRHGVTGLVVPPASPEALAGAFRELMASPALAASFGAAARQRFEQDFIIDRVARDVDNVYERVAG